MSKHSETIDEFYATTPETAEWLFEKVKERYDVRGFYALEPCVGSFVFPDAAPQLRWTTNDINKWTERKPDHNEDFLEADFPACDIILTNPPFGAGNKLAFNFARKACETANIVAMVVPSIMSEWTRRLDNAIPRDMKLVFSEKCPNQWFDLPDGSERRVRTHGIIFEKVPGYKRPKFQPPVQDTRTPFFEFCDDGDYGIRVFGDGLGDLWPREVCTGCFMPLKFHYQQMITGSRLIMSYPWRWHVGMGGRGRAPWCNDPPIVPRISGGVIYHFTNSLAVLEGRLEPLDGVDYDAFLKQTQERWSYGLQVHR